MAITKIPAGELDEGREGPGASQTSDPHNTSPSVLSSAIPDSLTSSLHSRFFLDSQTPCTTPSSYPLLQDPTGLLHHCTSYSNPLLLSESTTITQLAGGLMACKTDSNAGVCADADTITLAALDTFIATQRNLLAEQLADIDRLHQLKASLDSRLSRSSPAPPIQTSQDTLKLLTSTLAVAPTLALSTHADLALRLPPALDWAAFAMCDPAPMRALAVPPPSVPGSFLDPGHGPGVTRQHPSELQTLVQHASRTMLEPRMRRYPRVSTPSPSASGDEYDPINTRRAREHAKIRELREAVRRGGGGYAGGLRTMRMGVGVIRTDVDEDAMLGDVQIDEEGGGEGRGGGKGGWAAKGMGMGKHPPADKRPRGKTVPAAYLHANDNHGDDDAGAAPSHSTKNLGLVVAHAARSAVETNDTDKDLVLSDHELEETLLLSPRPPFGCVPEVESVLKGRMKPNQKPKVKAKARAKPKGKATAPASRAKKASYECSDEDYDEEEDVYKDPSAFVPSVTVYGSSSDDGDADVDMPAMDPSRMELNGDDEGADMDMDVDMDVDRTGTKPRAKVVSKKKTQQKNDSDNDDDDGPGGAGPTTAKPNTKLTSSSSSKPKPKPKPATFNLPWSTEEQHRLEQLLEEIPATARFRWQQISRAMGGRRTPRQVASRVQKYFEKMKKCGLM